MDLAFELRPVELTHAHRGYTEVSDALPSLNGHDFCSETAENRSGRKKSFEYNHEEFLEFCVNAEATA
jgi:hypothetical protein